jgi:hypothetical protein
MNCIKYNYNIFTLPVAKGDYARPSGTAPTNAVSIGNPLWKSIVAELPLSYLGSALVTYVVNPPTFSWHYLITYM